jgi:hypothetical protein
MILTSLGEAFSNEFRTCGHEAVNSAEGGKLILADLNSGNSNNVRKGLHQLSGHAKKEIVTTLPDQMTALKSVAGGVARGDFSIDTHGNLLAASQFQTAKLGKEADKLCGPEGILAVYHEAMSSPRAQARPDFKAWLTGTTVAGLRESSAPTEAEKLLKEILGNKALFGELEHKGPSQLREVLLVAAPKLCMPALFESYELALRYGSSRERGLALHNVSKLPEIISRLGSTHPSRMGLLARCQSYAEALSGLLAQPQVVVSDALKPEQNVTRIEIAKVLTSLQAVGR